MKREEFLKKVWECPAEVDALTKLLTEAYLLIDSEDVPLPPKVEGVEAETAYGRGWNEAIEAVEDMNAKDVPLKDGFYWVHLPDGTGWVIMKLVAGVWEYKNAKIRNKEMLAAGWPISEEITKPEPLKGDETV